MLQYMLWRVSGLAPGKAKPPCLGQPPLPGWREVCMGLGLGPSLAWWPGVTLDELGFLAAEGSGSEGRKNSLGNRRCGAATGFSLEGAVREGAEESRKECGQCSRVPPHWDSVTGHPLYLAGDPKSAGFVSWPASGALVGVKAWSSAHRGLPVQVGRAGVCVLKSPKEGMASPPGPRKALSGCPQARPGWGRGGGMKSQRRAGQVTLQREE